MSSERMERKALKGFEAIIKIMTGSRGRKKMTGFTAGKYVVATMAGLMLALMLSFGLAGQAEAYTISGKVKINGIGQGGLTVICRDKNTLTSYSYAQTNSDGSYAIYNSAGSNVLCGVVGASWDAKTSTYIQGSTYSFLPAKREVNIAMQDVGGIDFDGSNIPASVSGKVLFNNTTGVSGVDLQIRNNGTGFIYAYAKTDSSGNYSFTGLTSNFIDRYAIEVLGLYSPAGYIKYNYAPARITIDFFTNMTDVNFTAAANSYKISGRVTSGSTGLGGVTIEAMEETTSAKAAATVTDSQGYYSLTVQGYQAYLLSVKKQGYIITSKLGTDRIEFSSSEPTGTERKNADYIASNSPLNISGRILHNQSPLSGIDVSLVTGGEVYHSKTDASGIYSFSTTEKGSLRITPMSLAYTFAPGDQNIDVIDRDVTAPDITASKINFIIRGRVATSSGDPIFGLTMKLDGGPTSMTTTTDAEGKYSFSWLTGTSVYKVTATGNINATTTEAGWIGFMGSTEHVVDFLANLLTLNFRIASSVGVPLADVDCSLTGTASVNQKSNADGMCYFKNLFPGDYAAVFTKAGYSFEPERKSITMTGAGGNASPTVYVENIVVKPRLTGSVMVSHPVGASQGPLEGVTVTLSGGGSVSLTTMTDSNGAYVFSNVTTGINYTVSASKSGFNMKPVSQSVAPAGPSTSGPYFYATPYYDIKGTVTEGTSPVSGTEVTLSMGNVVKKMITDSLGGYAFSQIEEGIYYISGSKAGYRVVIDSPLTNPVTVNTNNLSVNLKATSISITGKVMSGTTPLSGVTVTATLSGTTTAKTATTGTDGSYIIGGGITNGTYTVTAVLAGYTMAPASQAVTVASANVTGKDFTATPITYAISGTVTGGSGATMTLSGSASKTATADAAGNYSFTGLLAGSYTVTAAKTGYAMAPASQAVAVSGANVTGKNFTATLITYAISGTVTGGGGATVTLSGAAAKTTTADAAGNYSFTGLLAGSYTVTAAKTGYTMAPASQAVAVSGANVTGKNFSATLITYAIKGSVKLGTIGLSGASMTATAGTMATTPVTTGADGSFTIPALVPGTYTVTATKAGYTVSAAQSVMLSTADATVPAFSATLITYPITGKVTSGTVGLGGVKVSVSGTALSAITAADGTYTISSVAPSATVYTVTPTLAGYAFTPANKPVTVSNASVAGVNFATYSIKGSVMSGSIGLSGATVTAKLGATPIRSVTTIADGSFTIQGLPAGTYMVAAATAGYTVSAYQTVTISAADATVPAFTATLITYAISGTVTGGSGATMTLSGSAAKTATADALGNYSFTGL
ncbi:MAG: carboxypeptidase regulatory-like domain-containing protein, partial [Nitrospirae bacterium]|nr:carboxypeptidase regulatory-like domain-containing protein [Nitrospirota bacterium]